MIDHRTQRVICVTTSRGKTHDFALFKDSRLAIAPSIAPSIELLADTGYLGIDKLHKNSHTPHKKSKHHPLTLEHKQQNRALAGSRICVEHSIRYLKRFRILSGTYRNKRKPFGLRLHLLAAIANLHR